MQTQYLGSSRAAVGHCRRPNLHFLAQADYSVESSETYFAFEIGFEGHYWVESLSAMAQIAVVDAADPQPCFEERQSEGLYLSFHIFQTPHDSLHGGYSRDFESLMGDLRKGNSPS